MIVNRKIGSAILVGLVLTLALAASVAAQSIPDFTFLHVSDIHAPLSPSGSTIAEIPNLASVEMTSYGVTADPPSFVIASGDLTEFGPFEGAWNQYLSWWKDVEIPVYHQSGNHDGTWYCIRQALRRWHGSHCYSFDKFGCHFIGLDTSTPQDPRPSITLEQLFWLEEDLAKVGPETPVFVFFHHPLGGGEFASPYVCDRLIDMLRPYNVALLMAGHSHGSKHMDIAGLDLTVGGSTLKPVPGYSVVSVKDGVLYVAYKKAGEADASVAVFKKPLPTKSNYPAIKITRPRKGSTYRLPTTGVRVAISGNESPVQNATYTVDDSVEGKLAFEGPHYIGAIELEGLARGAHYVRVTLTDEAGRVFRKSMSFYTELTGPRALWRSFAAGSCKATPAVTEDTVYVGATDGKLYAFRRIDGRLRWTFDTGGEILCEPLVVGETVYFGSGDGNFYAVDSSGKFKWSFEADGPIYSSPVYASGLVLFGCNCATLYALDADAGVVVWRCDDPNYSIESKPFVDGDTVYFGAWDTYVYAVDVKTGRLKWKCVGKGSAGNPPGVAKYYSPADCGPVAAGGKVFIPDRHHDLSIIDAASGTVVSSIEKCSGVGLSEDGTAVYLRRNTGNLTKIDLEGNEIWSVPADLDRTPAAPVEKDGTVYIASGPGLVRAIRAADGAELWQYQATPKLFVMSSVEAADGVAYVTGMGGSVTAIRAR